MKRIILAVVTGLALNFVLSNGLDAALHAAGVFPPYGQPMFDTGLVLLAFAYRAAFIVLCGYVAAAIAKEHARKAVLWIGIIGSLLWLAGAIAFWDYTPVYYNLAGIFLGLPLALLGYKLYRLKTEKPGHRVTVPH